MDEYPYCTERAIDIAGKMKQHLATIYETMWSCCLLLANHWSAGHIATSGAMNARYSSKCVSACVHVLYI